MIFSASLAAGRHSPLIDSSNVGHAMHNFVIVFDSEAPFRGTPKPGPLGQDALLSDIRLLNTKTVPGCIILIT